MSLWKKLAAVAMLLAGVLVSVDADAVERQRANLILRQPFNLNLPGARVFNGTTDYCQLPLVWPSGTSKAAFSFWLWWNAYANDFHLAAEYGDGANNYAGGYSFDPNFSTGVWQVLASGATNNSSTTKTFTRPSSAAWHHFVINIDLGTAGAGAIPSVYVDGVNQSLTTGSSLSGAGSFANGLTTNIMCRGTGSSLFGAGRMHQFAIYAGVNLSSIQASSLYNNGSGGDPRTCIGVMPLFYCPSFNSLAGVGIRGGALPGGIYNK